ncbi:hypothetical protein FRB97_007225 [Tulasnella sp. 331]|nr:hypothetical protein FRB97_007225 [Tulasnella sp. 331]
MDSIRYKLKTLSKPVHLMNSERRDYLIGIVLLLVVVLEWTGSGFLTQGLFNEGYEKPFLRGYDPLPNDASADLQETYISSTTSFLGSESQHSPPTSEDLPPLTTRETARLASIFCFFWFIANWSVNASLDFTSVASSTILSSMSGFFTLGVGRLLGVETFTLWKLGAVLTSSFGILLVSFGDSNTQEASSPLAGPPPASNHTSNSTALFIRSTSLATVPLADAVTHPSTAYPILGDCLALLSALFYALYVTLLKVRIRNESRVNMQLFFGFVGVINMITLWPVGVILHLTGAEPFEWPSSGAVWTVVGINMFITLSSDYIYLIAMLKTTPLVVTIGLSLTIPFAVLGDWTILNIGATWQTVIGATLVIGSFIALGIEGSQSEVGSNVEVTQSGYEGLNASSEDIDSEESGRGRSSERKSLSVMTLTEGASTRGMVSRSPDIDQQRRGGRSPGGDILDAARNGN